MDRRQFTKGTAITSAAIILSALPVAKALALKKEVIKFRLLRHATLLIEVGRKKILVDPMLSKKEAMDPVANAENNLRIPMVALPIDERELNQLLSEIDAVLITHTHRDHWDAAAQQLIAKDKIVFCQPADEAKLKEQGFLKVIVIEETYNWNSIQIHRTGGQHGTGEVGKKMGTVSGFVLEYKKQKVYIAGDTIWCNEVADAITKHQPNHIIINGGGARFLQGDPITMTTTDMVTLAGFTPASITVVHLESVNHCLQRRNDFKEAATANGLTKQVTIPADGDWVTI